MDIQYDSMGVLFICESVTPFGATVALRAYTMITGRYRGDIVP